MFTRADTYIQLLNAEQYVQVKKLRDNARHGISPSVRGVCRAARGRVMADEQEVWMYLLDVLSADKTQEITSILNLSTLYQNLNSSLPSHLTSLITQTALEHHTRRFFNPTYAGLITSLTAETTSSSDKTFSTRDTTANSPNMSTDTRHTAQTKNEDGELNTIRSQYSRFLPPPPSSPPSRNAFISTVLEVLGKYHNIRLAKGEDVESRRELSGLDDSERDWVYLVSPFVCCLTRSSAVCLGFEKLMERMG